VALVPEIIKVSVDPAAGGELSYTADEDMTIHSFKFALVTSAVVANRQVILVADDGNAANRFWMTASSYLQPASSGNVNYVAFEGVVNVQNVGVVTMPLPTLGLKLRKGDRLQTVTVNLDAGDNYTSAWIQAEREYS
jgi:hypothetical protein